MFASSRRSGLCGFYATMAHHAASMGSTHPVVGASGAVSALLGAMVVSHPNLSIRVGYFWLIGFRPLFGTFEAPAWLLIGAWFGLQLLMVWLGWSEGVAYWAHIGGCILGAGSTWLFRSLGWVKTEAHDPPPSRR